ncbi:helix-turn-helix domain-containing protein [Alcaligenes aquatilis]|uniref:helix-turn-helix domain-containing protein n=1 Tax=Alcaligenes aquatilis TaxID=323284 RepID=UPI002AA66DD3|nr:helix-turn-helix domain-containing protein [Alcaligenes faecalis]
MDDQAFPSGNNGTEHVVQAEQPAFSRTQVAATTRAFQDISGQIEQARSVITNSMTNASAMGYDAFQQAWNARETLNTLHEQADTLQTGLAQFVPQVSTFQGNLSQEERNQILHLYRSGLYTQQQLADQYGVSQATIARLVAA